MPRLTPCQADVRHLTLHIGITIHILLMLDTVWGRALRVRLAVATEGATARETLRYTYSLTVSTLESGTAVPTDGESRLIIRP